MPNGAPAFLLVSIVRAEKVKQGEFSLFGTRKSIWPVKLRIKTPLLRKSRATTVTWQTAYKSNECVCRHCKQKFFY